MQFEISSSAFETLTSTPDAQGNSIQVVIVSCPPPLFRTYKKAAGVVVRFEPSPALDLVCLDPIEVLCWSVKHTSPRWAFHMHAGDAGSLGDHERDGGATATPSLHMESFFAGNTGSIDQGCVHGGSCAGGTGPSELHC